MLTLQRTAGLGLLVLATLGLARPALAQAGKNGALTVNAAGTVVNTYTALTADAAAGSAVLTVASTTGLSAGDLVLIIQMQGAEINTTNTAAYGAITDLRTAGNNALAVVQAVTATTVSLSQPLTKTFSAAGKTQVVRIPRYTDATINGGGSITGAVWNGSTGGVVALEAQGTVTVDGTITATGLGFRGGAFTNNATDNNTRYVGTGNTGGEKGESIAGYGTDYANGSRGRGAPANGGGGGNSVNAGGGGGANGGSVAAWTGLGRPSLTTAAWASAWNLEANGFATSNSSGGGRGGYGVSDDNLDALTVGPDQAAWGAYRRPNTGGFGGRPLDYSSGRLYLGGGGGTGDGNTSVAGVGGRGGGLIYLIGGAVSGSGTIVADGAAGTTSFANNPFADGAGGGGGGGAIVLNPVTSIVNVRLQASGGTGGNTENTVDKAYGPGGGGGAGYIGLTSTASFSNVTIALQGGTNGNSTSPGMAEFTPNGATRGGTSSFSFLTVAAVPLPVAWLRFTATEAGNRVQLSWATAQEKNSAYFQPERSLDGRRFTAIGEPQPAAGYSSTERRYTATDAPPAADKAYYRIRQVDTDGTVSYSAVAVVTGRPAELAAYPNPVRRGQPLRLSTSAAVVVTDVLGRTVAAPSRSTADGPATLDTQALQPGQYWLRVAGGKAQRITVVPE